MAVASSFFIRSAYMNWMMKKKTVMMAKNIAERIFGSVVTNSLRTCMMVMVVSWLLGLIIACAFL